MNHINSALIEGILVADPKRIDLSDAPEGCRLVKFDVASDRYYMDRNGKKAVETVFVSVQCWGQLGDRCLERMSKGMTARVVGRLRQCRWLSSDGSSRKSIELVADHVEFRSPRSMGRPDPANEVLEGSAEDRERLGEPEVLYSF